MNPRPRPALIALAALFGLTAVLLGAFGAHGLEGRVSAERLAVWDTGAHYLGWHATTLLGISLLGGRRPDIPVTVAAWAMVVGCLLFSGSLFVLVLTDTPAWGAVTPLGGIALAVGWGALLVGALRVRQGVGQGHTGDGGRNLD
jgi:uncharacterized membrane protein YgdD (TMEM256/DUF423 family)